VRNSSAPKLHVQFRTLYAVQKPKARAVFEASKALKKPVLLTVFHVENVFSTFCAQIMKKGHSGEVLACCSLKRNVTKPDKIYIYGVNLGQLTGCFVGF
jgi:hypothetical protein